MDQLVWNGIFSLFYSKVFWISNVSERNSFCQYKSHLCGWEPTFFQSRSIHRASISQVLFPANRDEWIYLDSMDKWILLGFFGYYGYHIHIYIIQIMVNLFIRILLDTWNIYQNAALFWLARKVVVCPLVSRYPLVSMDKWIVGYLKLSW